MRAMMHLIRTALSRDLGGMGSVDLYRHSHVDTKALIERYVDAALQTIEAVVAQAEPTPAPQGPGSGPGIAPGPGPGPGPDADAPHPRDLLEGMLLSRQSFGRSALLSGGGTYGMTHIGVVKALLGAFPHGDLAVF